jgi:hypothetical protein
VYVRYLLKEKCRCSEDVRRELLYYYSIAMLVLIGSVVLMVPVLGVLMGRFGALSLKGLTALDKEISSVATNPMGAVNKLPRALRTAQRAFRPRTRGRR